MTIATARLRANKLVAINPVGVRGRWTGVSGASFTRLTGRGITSVVRTGSGAFTVTFDAVGEVLTGFDVTICTATGAAAKKIVNGLTYSASAKTHTFEVSDVATPTLADPATGDIITITASWDDSDAA